MDFDPNNNVVKLCLQGMDLEGKGKLDEAAFVFQQAWNEATNDLEKFLAAHYIARHQKNIHNKLQWFEKALHFALQLNNNTVKGAFSSLYANIANCYKELNEPEEAKKNEELAMLFKDKLYDDGPFYHGTRADLQVGDLLTAGWKSNYNAEVIMNHVYFTALVHGAGLAAALAKGDGNERVYVVEPTGSFENDPNVTDKKFPGNPTRSYRTQFSLKIIGEVTDWVRQTPEQLQRWRDKLANTKKGDIIN